MIFSAFFTLIKFYAVQKFDSLLLLSPKIAAAVQIGTTVPFYFLNTLLSIVYDRLTCLSNLNSGIG